MKYENTFVRCNDAAHFKAVAEAYQRAGYTPSGGVRGEIEKYTGVYPILGDVGKEVWMDVRSLKKSGTELFLVNGELVPKDTPQTKPHTSRRTEITYNEVTGEVISFKNVLTREEAERLAPGYTTKFPAYWLEEDCIFLNMPIPYKIKKGGRVLTERRIEWLEQAGDRFTELRKEHEQKSVKTVVI
jgi:hypothetical protein